MPETNAAASADQPLDRSTDPSEAFQPLGNEVRTRVLAALLEDGSPAIRTFSELFEASGADTTAGFAYHLRQLTDRYLRETDDGYTLTYAGTQVARDIASGAFTESFDRGPVRIDDPCPFCGATGSAADADENSEDPSGESGLVASATDNTVSVECRACDRSLLRLPFPPGGFRTHDDEELPAAFDRLHRHRVALMTAGTCPECGGATTVDTEAAGYGDVAGDEDGSAESHQPADSESGDEPAHPLLRLSCAGCAYTMRCPVTLATLDHPAVVAFYHEHGDDVRERPIWNVGAEWRETVLSTEPWCVRVSTVLDDDGLELLVSRDGRVVETSRFSVGEAS